MRYKSQVIKGNREFIQFIQEVPGGIGPIWALWSLFGAHYDWFLNNESSVMQNPAVLATAIASSLLIGGIPAFIDYVDDKRSAALSSEENQKSKPLRATKAIAKFIKIVPGAGGAVFACFMIFLACYDRFIQKQGSLMANPIFFGTTMAVTELAMCLACIHHIDDFLGARTKNNSATSSLTLENGEAKNIAVKQQKHKPLQAIKSTVNYICRNPGAGGAVWALFMMSFAIYDQCHSDRGSLMDNAPFFGVAVLTSLVVITMAHIDYIDEKRTQKQGETTPLLFSKQANIQVVSKTEVEIDADAETLVVNK